MGAHAVDGDPATRWGSAYADPQWTSVDLGVVRALTRVRLRWKVAYARAYRVETSTDGASWTTVWSTTTGDGGVDELTLSGATGRHLRIDGTQRGPTGATRCGSCRSGDHRRVPARQ
ncbi:discoidin domain-containing protein [Micromonospora phytophila]|uniref:discoidin domain-containing protein n=1 Tax=Micromonospora phytophila TaxID=709888 RepID=UPI00202DE8E9|nr:discoidin domain-containing protein [Micromonospora phytophila]MCM0676797.1 discoidin domain-containing protein [Micromonospora phytophila]